MSIFDYFFKSRVVFVAEKKEFENLKPGSKGKELFKVAIVTNGNELSRFSNSDETLSFFQKRLARQTPLTLALVHSRKRLAGYYWGVVGQSGLTLWHDKYPIHEKEGLVFNAFVFPEFRRQGVYRLLQRELHKHLFFHEDCEKIFTIVEKKNRPSLKANVDFGLREFCKNYLLKLFGKNILSVIKNQEGVQIYYVGHGPQSHSF